MQEKRKLSKKSLIFILVIALLLVIECAFILPIPYYIEVPGSADKLASFVTVDGKQDKHKGSFMLTTVGIKRATPASALIAKFSPSEELYSKEDLMGTSTNEEYNQIQQYYMESSQNAAIMQALKLANKPYKMDYKGIYVMEIVKNSDFKGKLQIGDIIYEVDGHQFTSSNEFMKYVKDQKVGQTVTVGYERDGKKAKTSGKLIQLSTDKKPGIGITLVDHTNISSDYQIKIDAGSIGGPSAGMMFTLETYSLITGKDLRQGHEIAGTGTMNTDGTIGRIGGIDKKVIAANEAGADIFFAPDDTITKEMKKADPSIQTNYQEALASAKRIHSKMKIVPIQTLQDAVDYLKALKK